MNLFSMDETLKPLAERMKPQNFDELVGQEKVLGKGKLLRNLVEADRLTSLILYGPPGCGKTSIAKVISHLTKSDFVTLNAVTDGLKEVREVIAKAKERIELYSLRTIVFVDEIHRFNKTQQDGLLPAVEKGYIILIGATTFNPFFYLVPALSSRTTIIKLEPLIEDDLRKILKNTLSDEKRGYGKEKIEIEDTAVEFLITNATGDARRLLNALEIAFLTSSKDETNLIRITLDEAKESIQTRAIVYDRDGDFHYDVISAFIKSMRGSDVNAALYYLALMLEAGENVSFIARRCAIFAAEDIGLAEPFALTLAQNAYDLVERIGMPESSLILSMLVTYLAGSPKSNSTTIAINLATEYVKSGKSLPVPKHLKDSHYTGSKILEHGIGYKYPHDYKGHWVDQVYCEKEFTFYIPTNQGREKKIGEYLEFIKKLKRTE